MTVHTTYNTHLKVIKNNTYTCITPHKRKVIKVCMSPIKKKFAAIGIGKFQRYGLGWFLNTRVAIPKLVPKTTQAVRSPVAIKVNYMLSQSMFV